MLLSVEKLKQSCLLHIVLLTTILCEESAAAKALNKECAKRCGNLSIERPFGIGVECSENEYFEITCKGSSNPKPILTKFNLELLNYLSHGGYHRHEMTVNMPVAKACGSNATNTKGPKHEAISWVSLNLSGSPFYIDYSNVFGSIGCHGSATLYNETQGVLDWCTSTCDVSNTEATTSVCNGYACCQSVLKHSVVSSRALRIKASVSKVGSCRSAFITRQDSLYFNASAAPPIAHPTVLPLVLSWNTPYDEEVDILISICGVSGFLLGSFLVSCACLWSCWFYKTKETRKATRLRTKYFKGRLQLSSSRESAYVTQLFTEKELKIATHNFNEDQILGEGGQGIVYKGKLPDGRIVAVKRSKTFAETQWKQFINEVILLSQMNHKNIVKLLGCCLETKLPLVVYEFVPNGTLSQHIHNDTHELVPMWDIRVRIASEAADAIAYLHSSSSNPIYHRDIKSNNILLDENFEAKVSDFGISKAIPKDQTHLTTCVKGTFGYLDPEYFRSSQFSDKSDVYSFGVIMVELLTRQRPIRVSTSNEKEISLVEYFKSAMNELALDKILDPMVLEGSTKEDVMLMANLAKQCLNSRGVERPTMREVAMELEGLKKKLFSNKEIIVRKCPIEIEHVLSIPTVMTDYAYTTSAIGELVNTSHDYCGGEQHLLSTTW